MELRKLLFKILSDNKPENDESVKFQPVLTTGEGSVKLEKCVLGYLHSERFWNGYCHIEARFPVLKSLFQITSS